MDDDAPFERRARQNVVLELGFFVGALGQAHVAVLYESGVTKPSGIDGLVYIPYDDQGAWKLPLARELKAAGVGVDANRLL
jgi:predicted nucleotide-binding protein